MNEVALSTFSSFDSGKHPSGKSEPERFYHGFVLGLLVELRDKYEVQSNRVSGYGTPILVFLGIVALTTGLELLTSYIMEWTTGGWLWDYDRFAWNFQGRIALNPSIRFGIGGMFFLYCVQPLLEKADGVLTEKTRSLLSGSLFVLICVDFLYHVFLKV